MKKLKVLCTLLVIGTISVAALAYTNIINLGPAKKLVSFGMDMVFNKAKNLTAKSGPSLARYLPEQTTIYLEANNLADIFEHKSSGASTQSVLDATFDLTPEEHALLSQTHIALALWPNQQDKSLSSLNSLDSVVVLETPNEKMTNKIAPALADLLKAPLSYSSGNSTTDIKPLDGTNVVVIGKTEVVKNLLASRSSQKPLLELSDFQKLKRANPDHSHFFLYLSATQLKNSSLVSANNSAFLKNVKAFSVNFGTDVKEKPRLSILADTNALVNEVFSGEFPISDFHLAELTPADAAFFITCKLSSKQLSKDPSNNNDSLLSTQLTKEFGVSSLTELDRFTDQNIKQQLLDNLTGDVAFFLSLSGKEEKVSFFPKVAKAVIIETKNINTAKDLIEKSMASSGTTKKDYQGNTIYYLSTNALAFAKQSMVVGEKEAVEKALDAASGKPNLTSEKEFKSVLKEFSSTGLGLTYINAAPVLRHSSGQVKVILSSILGTFPAQFGFFGGVDGQEIYVEPSFSFSSGETLNNLYYPLVGGLSYWWQLSSILAPKPSYSTSSNNPYANNPSIYSTNPSQNTTAAENSAMETLRLLHSVEATYQAGIGNGQFGNAQQLAANQFIDVALTDALTKNLPKNNYIFTLRAEPGTAGKLSSFQATATPVVPGNERAFYVDETGVIRYTREPRASQQTDPPVN